MEPAARSRESVSGLVERVFAVTSVVPLGAFVVLHVFDYGRVLLGAEAIGSRQAPPGWLLGAEALLVWFPLVLHAVLGLVFWKRRAREPLADPSARALLVVHRVTGLAIAVFLVDHGVRFRLPILRGELVPADSVQRLAAELSRTHAGFPWIAALNLLGTIAVAFHFAFGLRRIAGRLPRFESSQVLRFASLAVGLALLLVGLFTLLYLAAG